MRKITFSLLLIVFAVVNIMAQGSKKTTPESRAKHDLQRVKDAINQNTDLSLSADQEQKLLDTYLAKYKCIQDARQTVGKEELRGEMRNCNKTSHDAFQSILSSEQLAFYREKQRETRMNRLQKRKDRGDREIEKLREVLQGDLALNSDQETAIKAVFEEEKQAYKDATELMKDKEAFQKRRKEIQKASKSKLKEILNEAQWNAAFTQNKK